MNLVVLSPIDPYPPTGGWALAVYQDILGLAELGHAVELFAVTEHAPSTSTPLHAHCNPHYIVRRKQPRWLRVLKNVGTPHPFLVSHYVIPELVQAVCDHVDKCPTDLLLAEDILLSPAAFQVRQRTGLPVYLRLHNVATQIFDRFGEEQSSRLLQHVARWQARKVVAWERDAINAADGVSSVSESDDQALIALVPGIRRPRDIVGFGANLDGLPCRLEGRDPRIIVHLGSLMQYTKLEGMQWFCDEVFPRIRAVHPDVCLELAGRMPEDVFDQVPGVRRLGVVGDPLPCLHRGRVFIAPQFVGSGMRLKLLNAMATGNAVICTRVACEGIPMIDGQHGLIRDDPRGFAEAVIQLLQDESRAQSLGAQARTLIEAHFDHRAVAKKLSVCLERCIASSHRRDEIRQVS